MRTRQLRTIGTARRSSIEPNTGLLSGAGARTLTLTVCGPPDTELPLAERGFVTALLDWARVQGADLSSLDPLRSATGSITGTELAAMIHQLTHFLDAIVAEVGWSLFASSSDRPRSYARALIPTVEPTVLLATPTATVAVDRAGLRLLLRGLTIIGWHRDAHRIVLQTADGEYPLRTTTITAALLRHLAHGHSHAALVRQPMADLAAPLLVGLHTAAAITTAHEQPVLLGSRSSGPITDLVYDEPVIARAHRAADPMIPGPD